MSTRTVRVYHNVYRRPDGRPEGMLSGYAPGHPVVLVAEYPATEEVTAEDECHEAFRLFNVGHDPEFGTPDDRAGVYRARDNRSLSIGDLVEVDGTFFACARFGWKTIERRPRIVSLSVYGTTAIVTERSA